MDNAHGIYLTTDTHFQHNKIFEYCDRPADYAQQLLEGYRSLSAEDILIHLGDICLGDPIETHRKYFEPLACKKILVRGNHDTKSNHWYYTHGWDFVCRQFVDTLYGVKVLFSHKPIRWDGYFDINIHGHLHDRYKAHSFSYLISLESMGYQPINLRAILEPIRAEIMKQRGE